MTSISSPKSAESMPKNRGGRRILTGKVLQLPLPQPLDDAFEAVGQMVAVSIEGQVEPFGGLFLGVYQ